MFISSSFKCSHKCFVWHRNTFDSVCTQRRRVAQYPPPLYLWNDYLLYWDLIEEMFRKLLSTSNLSRYWTSCFWITWSNMHCRKYNPGTEYLDLIVLYRMICYLRLILRLWITAGNSLCRAICMYTSHLILAYCKSHFLFCNR